MALLKRTSFLLSDYFHWSLQSIQKILLTWIERTKDSLQDPLISSLLWIPKVSYQKSAILYSLLRLILLQNITHDLFHGSYRSLLLGSFSSLGITQIVKVGSWLPKRRMSLSWMKRMMRVILLQQARIAHHTISRVLTPRVSITEWLSNSGEQFRNKDRSPPKTLTSLRP